MLSALLQFFEECVGFLWMPNHNLIVSALSDGVSYGGAAISMEAFARQCEFRAVPDKTVVVSFFQGEISPRLVTIVKSEAMCPRRDL